MNKEPGKPVRTTKGIVRLLIEEFYPELDEETVDQLVQKSRNTFTRFLWLLDTEPATKDSDDEIS